MYYMYADLGKTGVPYFTFQSITYRINSFMTVFMSSSVLKAKSQNPTKSTKQKQKKNKNNKKLLIN